MKILYHTWEPGVIGNQLTSGGGGAWTRFLLAKLMEAGHTVYWQTSIMSELDAVEDPPKDIDVAVFCWRWLFPDLEKYRERNLSFARQSFLLAHCAVNNIPFLVHDQDLKMKKEEREFIMAFGGKIATPSFYPARDELSLHFPNPYTSIIGSSRSLYPMAYIGNNYERLEQTLRLIGLFSKHRHAFMWGNWLEAGAERENPQLVKDLFPNVTFGGRLSQSSVIDVLSKAEATVLLHKPEYGPRGFVTIRWAEAAIAGCLPFIPREFELPYEFRLELEGLMVEDGDEIFYKLDSMDESEKARLIKTFRHLVSKYMTVEPWIEILERIANHD